MAFMPVSGTAADKEAFTALSIPERAGSVFCGTNSDIPLPCFSLRLIRLKKLKAESKEKGHKDGKTPVPKEYRKKPSAFF
jgi:hypothetical protein